MAQTRSFPPLIDTSAVFQRCSGFIVLNYSFKHTVDYIQYEHDRDRLFPTLSLAVPGYLLYSYMT